MIRTQCHRALSSASATTASRPIRPCIEIRFFTSQRRHLIRRVGNSNHVITARLGPDQDVRSRPESTTPPPSPSSSSSSTRSSSRSIRSTRTSTPPTPSTFPTTVKSSSPSSVSFSSINTSNQHVQQHAQQSQPPHHQQRATLLTLAIETSCDDTCVAIIEKRTASISSSPSIQSSPVSSPLATLHFNEKVTTPDGGHGGIHPIEALTSHNVNLAKMVDKAIAFLPDAITTSADLDEEGKDNLGINAATYTDMSNVIITKDDSLKRKPDFISVTRGPGMRSNLGVGLNVAKGLSLAWQVPLLGVHHMQAHALTLRLVNALKTSTDTSRDTAALTPDFPFLTLLVSGGHTMLVSSANLVSHKILATTTDIAIGDALDKCGRLLLPDSIKKTIKDTAYAKHLSAYAFPSIKDFRSWPVARARAEEIDKPENEFGWRIQTPLANTRELQFSFTSIWTEAERLVKLRTKDGVELSDEERLLMARTVIGTAFEQMGSRVVIALEWLRKERVRIPTLVVSGGVAANEFLRYFLRSILDVRGFHDVKLVFPPVALCTDNAAMIAWTGLEMFEAGYRSEYEIDPLRKWSMDAQSEDGGILGVGGWMKVSV